MPTDRQTDIDRQMVTEEQTGSQTDRKENTRSIQTNGEAGLEDKTKRQAG